MCRIEYIMQATLYGLPASLQHTGTSSSSLLTTMASKAQNVLAACARDECSVLLPLLNEGRDGGGHGKSAPLTNGSTSGTTNDSMLLWSEEVNVDFFWFFIHGTDPVFSAHTVGVQLSGVQDVENL